jgi:hypothetical protein
MDASKAFDRFEKSGAGFLPIVLLSAIAIAATAGVFHFAQQLRLIPPYAVTVLGALVAKSSGYGNQLEPITEAEEREAKFTKLVFDRKLLEEQYAYIGAFHRSRGRVCHVYVDLQNRTQVTAYRWSEEASKEGTDAKKKVPAGFIFTSYTEDGRVIRTVHADIEPLQGPWVSTEPVEGPGDASGLIEALRTRHLERIANETLRELTSDNTVSIAREQSDRTGAWLMSQAPLTVEKLETLSDAPVFGKKAKPKDKAAFLVGFCDGVADDADRVAFEAWNRELQAQGKPAVAAEDVVVIHAMTNRFHLINRVLPEEDTDEQEKIRKQMIARLGASVGNLMDGQEPPQEALAKMLQMLDPLSAPTLTGEIQQPFPAKFFLRKGPAREVEAVDQASSQSSSAPATSADR